MSILEPAQCAVAGHRGDVFMNYELSGFPPGQEIKNDGAPAVCWLQ